LPHRRSTEESWDLWDRRGFVAGAGAAIGACLVSETATTLAGTALASGMIVADSRFAASRDFAVEAARTGGRIVWIDGDITDLWYDELDLLWRRERNALSGMTEYGAFFCLERLALDRGLRVVFKGEHRNSASGIVMHTIAGPEAIVTHEVLDAFAGNCWAARTARMAMAACGGGLAATRLQTHVAADLEQPALLISWVLAPKSRVRGDIA
jgi:hypothetical protein